MEGSVLTVSKTVEDLDEENVPFVDLKFQGEIHEDIPVYEGSDLLRDLVKRKFNLSYSKAELYYWNSVYSKECIVIAWSENAALDWLANLGILDGMKIPKDEEESQLKERGMVDGIRLGNASEPFDLRNYRLEEIGLSDIKNFKKPIEFHEEGLMHIWKNNKFNNNPPYTDVFVRLNDFTDKGVEIDITEYWGPNEFSTPNSDYLHSLLLNEIWTAVQDKF